MPSPLLLQIPFAVASAGESVPVLDPSTIDWSPIGEETAELLSAYIQVDTRNPGGQEILGARFLAEWLAEQGISSTLHEYAEGRANLWARVEGTTDAPPLCLLSHIDVVPAEEERWTHPPMSGFIDEEGMVWGRGALDMKGMGAMEAMTLALVRRLPVPLERDVVLLAVADEEVDNTGIQAAIERWDEIGCSHVVNEGGIGLDSLLFDGQVMFPISVGEKGFLWGEVVATGAPGHGSVPVADTAPERLVRAYIAIAEREVTPTWDPALLELLSNVGAHKGGVAGFVLRQPWLVKTVLRGRLMDDPIIRATLVDTANLTGFEGALEPNVMPARVAANLDSRILPGTAAEEMRARLEAVVADAGVEGVEVVITSSQAGGMSPWNDPLYEALARRVVEDMPHAVAGPALSPGFTDSIYLRDIGVHAYGLVPVVVDEDGLRSMHGDNERVSTSNLERGVRVLFSAVTDVCQGSAGRWDGPVEALPVPAWDRPPDHAAGSDGAPHSKPTRP